MDAVMPLRDENIVLNGGGVGPLKNQMVEKLKLHHLEYNLVLHGATKENQLRDIYINRIN